MSRINQPIKRASSFCTRDNLALKVDTKHAVAHLSQCVHWRSIMVGDHCHNSTFVSAKCTFLAVYRFFAAASMHLRLQTVLLHWLVRNCVKLSTKLGNIKACTIIHQQLYYHYCLLRSIWRERERVLVSWLVFWPRQLGIISGLKETFIKRHIVERTKTAERGPEEQSGRTASCRENSCNEIKLKWP